MQPPSFNKCSARWEAAQQLAAAAGRARRRQRRRQPSRPAARCQLAKFCIALSLLSHAQQHCDAGPSSRSPLASHRPRTEEVGGHFVQIAQQLWRYSVQRSRRIAACHHCRRRSLLPPLTASAAAAACSCAAPRHRPPVARPASPPGAAAPWRCHGWWHLTWMPRSGVRCAARAAEPHRRTLSSRPAPAAVLDAGGRHYKL